MRRMLLMSVFLAVVALGGKALGAQDCPCIWIGPEDSIQAAIDAAPPGSTLCLPEGTWRENLVITKSLTLRGEGPDRTVIRPDDRAEIPPLGPVISVRPWWRRPPVSVVISGVTLIGSVPRWGTTSNAGLEAMGGTHVVIDNCHILDALNGVHLQDNSQAMLTGVTILGKEGQVRGVGIALWGRSQAMIEHSRMARLDDGIVANSMSQATVHNSTIEHTRFGVRLQEDAQAIITWTRFADSDDGVVLTGRSRAVIANCTMVRNGAGIAMMEHASAVIRDNVITGSRFYGVFLTVHVPLVWFEGLLVGAGNVIPGPDEPDGNRHGSVFPDEIAFLMTKDGGAYPGR